MSASHTFTSAAVATLNAGARILRRTGRTPPDLNPERLLRSAQRRTDLTDFGAWDIEEPLARLLHAYDAEANLTLVGRLAAREQAVSLLENLLYLEEERKHSGAIEQQEITAPLFIVGLPRTGTTLLHGLIAQDPATRTPLTWEVMYPAGFAETPRGVNRVKRKTTTRLVWADRLAPEFKRIHPIGADLPQECVALMAHGFSSLLFHSIHRVPSYQDWFERDSQTLAFDIHHRILQHLQARRGAKRWVLKGPGHLFGLRPLLQRYPDAKLVQIHRDPLKVMPSIASLNTSLRRAFSDHVDPREIAADWCARWAGALERFLHDRDTLAPDRFLDVAYEEIVVSPVQTVERIYEHLGWSLPDETRRAMNNFLAENPKDKHGAHRYSLAEYGLDRDTEVKRYAGYCERFNIPIADDQ